MNPTDTSRAVEAAFAVASAAGLRVDDTTVLHNSNRIAVRLLPCDVLARVAPGARTNAGFEVEVARQLTHAGSPVGTLDPRVSPVVHAHDGFAVTVWTYYDPLPGELVAPEYAHALLRLHAGMRQIDVPAPRFTDRVEEARSSLADRARTPDVGDADRQLLTSTLESVTASILNRSAGEQLLHGEPHAGNLLNTREGPRFIDLETCCRGPVEFDIAHAPEAVAAHYPGLNAALLAECRILMLAMIIAWRWDRDDDLPDGRRLAAAWTAQLRAALDARRVDAGR
ncbi:MAG TPA: phosphotransferase [Dehalococcoidia bacterium]|nr:phosphotransferase [Dehalococcoidia bacterium]